MEVFTADECWLDGWHTDPTLVVDEHGFRLATTKDPAATGHLKGIILPGFRDAHVHLGLVDGSALLSGGIAVAHDFGWHLEATTSWLGNPALPEVVLAGQLLTTPGGYPTASGWAPRAASREIAEPADADAAVREQLAAGATFIKVTLNTDAGPVLDDETLRAVVGSAHEHGVTVAAHTQGAGQAERAFDAGVDLLAHAPWSERLTEDLLVAMAGKIDWVSTLDIHGWGAFTQEFTTANDNVRRFHAAGGGIRYGTDLGNGPLPEGINIRELRALEHAGLGLDALAGAIAPATASGVFGARISRITEARPVELSSTTAATAISGDFDPSQWLSSAHLIDARSVKKYMT